MNDAYVQHCQQRMCSVRAMMQRCYTPFVQPEQRVIADWMIRTQERLGWSWAEWAKRAGIKAATTVTRAVKDDYASVTTVQTLDALAKAAGEPSVLDFLSGKSHVEGSGTRPSVEALSALVGAIAPLLPRGKLTAESERVVAEALSHGLELLGSDAANPDPQAIEVAARGVMFRFRDLTRQ